MKKLYFLTLAASVALSASAVNEATVQNAQSFQKSSKTLVRSFTTQTTPKPQRAADYDSYQWTELGTGKYGSSVVADIYGGSTEITDVTVFEAVGHPGVYKAVGVWPDMVENGTLIFDATDPNFVIVPKQLTGITDQADGATYIASMTYVYTEVEGYTKDDVMGQVPECVPVLSNGCINFPVKSLALNWPEAPATSETNPEGWYISSKSTGVLVLPGATYVEPWELLGEGTFTNNFFGPTFGVNDIAPYTVPVYRSTSNEDVYKIGHPWKGFWDAQGWSSESPAIELDATDATNILLPLTTTNINGRTDGVYYIMGNTWFIVNNDGQDPSTAAEDERITLTSEEQTEADGTYITRTFTFMPKSCLLLASATSKVYYMGGQGTPTNSTIVVKTKVDSQGISGIEEDSSNAPVKYFNLQGVEISEPATGTIVIRVQGDKATKTIVR